MAAALESQALAAAALSLVSIPTTIQSLLLLSECLWRNKGRGSRQKEVTVIFYESTLTLPRWRKRDSSAINSWPGGRVKRGSAAAARSCHEHGHVSRHLTV